MVNLKNYTTRVAAEKSIAEIESLLAKFGASAVMKQYLSDGRVISLAFKLGDKTYQLPANVDGVYGVMFGGVRERHGKNTMANRRTLAYNVAWRLLKDWVHAQLSIIASGQAEPEQVMFPYMFDGRRSIFEAYKSGQLKLGEAKEGCGG
jgi:hypothetical protein